MLSAAEGAILRKLASMTGWKGPMKELAEGTGMDGQHLYFWLQPRLPLLAAMGVSLDRTGRRTGPTLLAEWAITWAAGGPE